ncbi:MAG TPA: M20/M25/M40 family metallo-hydrolase [Thermoplasmata archaeon]|nr:M20/M25/M40 family metallo-hydrolase [Thermoplasmata archaeon]
MNEMELIHTKLTEFVRMPSSAETGVSGILEAARASAEEIGLRPTVHEGLGAIEASSGPGGLLLNGHLDTVPVASGWTKGQAVWEGDILYGRGSADMKAGCVAALAAARTLVERGKPVSLLFTTDEETTMAASKALAASPVVREAAAVVVLEPTSLHVIASEKGVLWYRVTTHGRSAHGSLPHLGDSAIQRTARALGRLEPLSRPRDVLGEITVNPGQIRGGVAPNVVADACTVELDCRHPPASPKSEVESLLRNAFQEPGGEVTFELVHEVPPAGVPFDAAHVRALQELAGTEIRGVAYATEMAWYAAHNPRCVVFGPGETARIHVPDERVSLRETVRAADLLVRYAERLAALPEG